MDCRIDDKNQVKVADFGLSHQLFEREYYSSKDHKAKLPIKWMALESLEDFVFTAKSDVVRVSVCNSFVWMFFCILSEIQLTFSGHYTFITVFREHKQFWVDLEVYCNGIMLTLFC